ncbi:unnamed protein product [Lactuca virosa]|uniref:Uncharacterized protein n=1 Tax=Lactuca virosa TaxID=75947 RepID=A0AAU9PCH8_9ASTR|nr:unnamed protein product [Lactuca virosa]
MQPEQDFLILYGQPSPSELSFMLSQETDMDFLGSADSSLDSLSSTESEAQSAPPFPEILESIGHTLNQLLNETERQLPPEWSMADLVRAVNADDLSSLVRDFYDLQSNGTHSWLWEEIYNLLDLINYVF